MATSFEQGRKQFKYLRAGALSFALILAACGSDEKSDRSGTPTTTTSTPNTPTARELAKEVGGSVSQFPAYEEGVKGVRRFCIEMGGEITGMSATLDEGMIVDCRVQDIDIQMNPDAVDEAFLQSVCKIAGGKVVQVAATDDRFYTVTACHTGIPAA